jgi:hypothetical protein
LTPRSPLLIPKRIIEKSLTALARAISLSVQFLADDEVRPVPSVAVVSTREEETMGHQDQAGRATGMSNPPRPAAPQRILEGAENCLRGHSYLALKNVTCDYREGVLTLRGCLPSYYLKQIAQTAVARLAGVDRIVNEIEVISVVMR